MLPKKEVDPRASRTNLEPGSCPSRACLVNVQASEQPRPPALACGDVLALRTCYVLEVRLGNNRLCQSADHGILMVGILLDLKTADVDLPQCGLRPFGRPCLFESQVWAHHEDNS